MTSRPPILRVRSAPAPRSQRGRRFPVRPYVERVVRLAAGLALEEVRRADAQGVGQPLEDVEIDGVNAGVLEPAHGCAPHLRARSASSVIVQPFESRSPRIRSRCQMVTCAANLCDSRQAFKRTLS